MNRGPGGGKGGWQWSWASRVPKQPPPRRPAVQPSAAPDIGEGFPNLGNDCYLLSLIQSLRGLSLPVQTYVPWPQCHPDLKQEVQAIMSRATTAEVLEKLSRESPDA